MYVLHAKTPEYVKLSVSQMLKNQLEKNEDLSKSDNWAKKSFLLTSF